VRRAILETEIDSSVMLPDSVVTATQSRTAPPILVEVRRGSMVESRHRGNYAVVDSAGAIVAAAGDVERPIYARSAIKPLLALPLIETGAAAASEAGEIELALAQASHGGEPFHTAAVAAWLARVGLSVDDLECGAHLPNHEPSAEALLRDGGAASALHNNCSGKHAGVLATCRHLGEPTKGYIAADHPAQARLTRALEEMCGLDLAGAPRGIDGCGFPQIGVSLTALARGLARYAAPDDLPPSRQAACRDLASAAIARPEFVSRSGHFSVTAMRACGGKAMIKSGAEGVYVAAIFPRGIGIAVKIEDGAGRAAEVAIAALVARHALLEESEREALRPLIEAPVANVVGRLVGAIAPAPNW
jgi:L-asparaginase II